MKTNEASSNEKYTVNSRAQASSKYTVRSISKLTMFTYDIF